MRRALPPVSLVVAAAGVAHAADTPEVSLSSAQVAALIEQLEADTAGARRKQVIVGPWGPRSAERNNVDFSSPLPFCIRSRGDKAVLFLRFGTKPDLVLEGGSRVSPASSIGLIGGFLSPEGRMRITNLSIRHLPKDTPLDAPVRMPSANPKADSEKQEW